MQILLKQTINTRVLMNEEQGLYENSEHLVGSGAVWVSDVQEFIPIFEKHMRCPCLGETIIPIETYKKIACDVFACCRPMGGELIALHNMMCENHDVVCLIFED